ncbi:hypothetical protein COCNU_scaffold004645G000020 [Cocos nucifera]|nr:hypothetical protein [Cocos nucifera]
MIPYESDEIMGPEMLLRHLSSYGLGCISHHGWFGSIPASLLIDFDSTDLVVYRLSPHVGDANKGVEVLVHEAELVISSIGGGCELVEEGGEIDGVVSNEDLGVISDIGEKYSGRYLQDLIDCGITSPGDHATQAMRNPSNLESATVSECVLEVGFSYNPRHQV